jgi:hypothetical protein
MLDDGIIPLLIRESVQCGFYLSPDLFEFRGIRKKGSLIQYPPDPSAPCVTDDKTPAAVVTADLRTGQMHGAPRLTFPVKPQKGACLWDIFNTRSVFIESNLVCIYANFLYIAGIKVVDDKGVVTAVFSNGMDKLHVTAAVTALGTFTGDGRIPPEYWIFCAGQWSLNERFVLVGIRCVICSFHPFGIKDGF